MRFPPATDLPVEYVLLRIPTCSGPEAGPPRLQTHPQAPSSLKRGGPCVQHDADARRPLQGLIQLMLIVGVCTELRKGHILPKGSKAFVPPQESLLPAKAQMNEKPRFAIPQPKPRFTVPQAAHNMPQRKAKTTSEPR